MRPAERVSVSLQLDSVGTPDDALARKLLEQERERCEADARDARLELLEQLERGRGAA